MQYCDVQCCCISDCFSTSLLWSRRCCITVVWWWARVLWKTCKERTKLGEMRLCVLWMPAGRYDITCKLLSVVFCGPRFFFERFRTKKGFQNCWCLKKVLQLWHKLSIGILQLVVHVVQSSNAVEKGIHQDQTNKFPLFSFSQDASFSSTWTMFASFISKVFSCYYIVSSRTDSWIINFIIWLVKYMPTNPKG